MALGSRILLACLCLRLGVPAIGASAQDSDPQAQLRRAVANTPRSTTVRVQVFDGQVLSDALFDTVPGGIAIAAESGGLLDVPYADIERYWERRRSIRGGMIRGGIAGIILGGLSSILLQAACEYECNSLGEDILIGAGYIGAAGAGVGGLIGAAIPRWSLRWTAPFQSVVAPIPQPRPAAPAAPPPAIPTPGPVVAERVPDTGVQPRERRIGEVTYQVIGAWGGAAGFDDGVEVRRAERGAMIGGSAALAFRVGRLGFGPEVVALLGEPGVVALSAVTRFDLGGATARLNPYLLTGIGGYNWQGESTATDALLTVLVGAGVTFGDSGRWRAEARWHPVVHNTFLPKPALFTVGWGRRRVW